jgi:hypothetical protein
MAVIRAVLDTSIYVSALLASKGASGRILEAGFERRLFVPQAGTFAENLIVAGLDLGSLGLGSRVRLGGEAILGITQIGKHCHDRCAIFHHDLPGDRVQSDQRVAGYLEILDHLVLTAIERAEHLRNIEMDDGPDLVHHPVEARAV